MLQHGVSSGGSTTTYVKNFPLVTLVGHAYIAVCMTNTTVYRPTPYYVVAISCNHKSHRHKHSPMCVIRR